LIVSQPITVDSQPTNHC